MEKSLSLNAGYFIADQIYKMLALNMDKLVTNEAMNSQNEQIMQMKIIYLAH